MNIDESLTTDDYDLVNGDSSIQTNGYDCGVFSLMNIEKYVMMRPHNHPIIQSLMGLFRLRILGRLYHQAIDQGLVE